MGEIESAGSEWHGRWKEDGGAKGRRLKRMSVTICWCPLAFVGEGDYGEHCALCTVTRAMMTVGLWDLVGCGGSKNIWGGLK